LSLQIIVGYKLDLMRPYVEIETPETAPEQISNMTTPLGGFSHMPAQDPVTVGGLDWGEIESKVSTGLDWGEMESKVSTGLDWGEMESQSGLKLDFEDMETGIETKSNIVSRNSGQEEVMNTEELMLVTSKELLTMKAVVTNMQIYKKFLLMRILHDLHNSCMVVNQFSEDLKSDPILTEYFEYLRKGFDSLAEVTDLNLYNIGEIIAHRVVEMRAGLVFLDLLPLDNEVESYATLVEKMLIDQASLLSNNFFDGHIEKSQDWCLNINARSIELLRGWKSWTMKRPGGPHSQSLACFVLVTGYIIQLAVSSSLKNNNRLWWISGLSEKFFDFLLKEKFADLGSLIEDIIMDRNAISHPV
jgi:hypothetical protein